MPRRLSVTILTGITSSDQAIHINEYSKVRYPIDWCSSTAIQLAPDPEYRTIVVTVVCTVYPSSPPTSSHTLRAVALVDSAVPAQYLPTSHHYTLKCSFSSPQGSIWQDLLRIIERINSRSDEV